MRGPSSLAVQSLKPYLLPTGSRSADPTQRWFTHVLSTISPSVVVRDESGPDGGRSEWESEVYSVDGDGDVRVTLYFSYRLPWAAVVESRASTNPTTAKYIGFATESSGSPLARDLASAISRCGFYVASEQVARAVVDRPREGALPCPQGRATVWEVLFDDNEDLLPWDL